MDSQKTHKMSRLYATWNKVHANDSMKTRLTAQANHIPKAPWETLGMLHTLYSVTLNKNLHMRIQQTSLKKKKTWAP
jgi:hypothetical protein